MAFPIFGVSHTPEATFPRQRNISMEIDKRWLALPILIAIVFAFIVIVPSFFGWHINYGSSYGETFKGLTWTYEIFPTVADITVGTNVVYSQKSRRLMKRVSMISEDGGWVWVMGDSDQDGGSTGSHEHGWVRLPWVASPPKPGENLVVSHVVKKYFSIGDFRSKLERDALFLYGPDNVHKKGDLIAISEGKNIRIYVKEKQIFEGQYRFGRWQEDEIILYKDIAYNAVSVYRLGNQGILTLVSKPLLIKKGKLVLRPSPLPPINLSVSLIDYALIGVIAPITQIRVGKSGWIDVKSTYVSEEKNRINGGVTVISPPKGVSFKVPCEVEVR